MKKAVGLHIGDARVSAALVAKRGGRPVVLDFVTSPLHLEGTATLRDALLDAVNLVMDEMGVALEDVVVSIPSNRCILSSISLPFTDSRKIGRTVKFDAEDELPCNADSVTLDWFEVRRSQHSSQIMTVAVKKEVLRDHLDLLERCDVEAVAVQPDFCALHNAVTALDGNDESRLVVRVGEKSLSLLAEISGRPAFYTESDLNGLPLPRLLEGCLAAFETRLPDQEFGRVVLTGEGPCDEIREALGASYPDCVGGLDYGETASRLDPEKREGFLKHGLVAFGLALRELVPVDVECDLRREGLAYPNKFSPFKMPAAVALCALFLILFVLAFSLRRNIAGREEELTRLNAAMEERWRESFRKSGAPKTGILARMRSEIEMLKGVTEGHTSLKYADYALPALRDVIKRIDPEAEDLVIESVELKQGTSAGRLDESSDPYIVLKASVATTDANVGYKIRDLVQESPYVNGVRHDQFRSENGRLPLNLRIILECGQDDEEH